MRVDRLVGQQLGGLVVDRQFSPSTLPETGAGQGAVLALEIVNARTALLGTTQLLDAVALDRYSFTRDAYLQRRLDLVFDGAPPLDDIYDTDDDGGDAQPPAAAPTVPVTPGAAASAPPAAGR